MSSLAASVFSEISRAFWGGLSLSDFLRSDAEGRRCR
jgi:uncharacterized protein DUF4326